MTRVLITGGAGFIGCNLADQLAREGHHVTIYDSLARAGVEDNLAWLRARHGERLAACVADIRDARRLTEALKGMGAVFHLAAQVAVTTSFLDPRGDFDVNLLGTINLLEGMRAVCPEAALLFASTNKVYGDLGGITLSLEPGGWLPRQRGLRDHGVGESQPLDFKTPYGCSKGAADQYVLDHARSFGMRAAVLRMSCIYGNRQLGTEDQGWVAHFARQAAAGKPITLYGDGRQVRDVLDVRDAVDAYRRAWASIDTIRGEAFNLGGGPQNAVSLQTLIAHLAELGGRKIDIRAGRWRAGDQRYFVADMRKLQTALGFTPRIAWRDGVRDLVHGLVQAAASRRVAEAA